MTDSNKYIKKNYIHINTKFVLTIDSRQTTFQQHGLTKQEHATKYLEIDDQYSNKYIYYFRLFEKIIFFITTFIPWQDCW